MKNLHAPQQLNLAKPSIDYARRRQQLAAKVGSKGIALLAATPAKSRNNDVEYPYRADSDFRYITGFLEPEAIAVIAPEYSEGEYIIFCRERDPAMEIWNGYRAGLAGACERYGADVAYAIDDFPEKMAELLAGREQVFMPLHSQPLFRDEVLAIIDDLPAGRDAPAPQRIEALDHWLHEKRLHKDAQELELMAAAAELSAQAHIAAMQLAKPDLYEYQLAARIHYEFESHCATWAYPTIVGGGANGCVLHYIENDQPLKAGDLVLIDAGAEYQGYAGDITRTFPVNGQFSEPQLQLYNIVLAANKAGIAAAQVGAAADATHQAALQVLVSGLIELGLLEDTLEQALESGSYRRFYMHGTSHWLGMDVHDVGAYKHGEQWRPLAEGMVLTVEPGLYIPEEDDIPKPYQGIGIRIEDNVVVTAQGPQVLTATVPKEPAEIEALMQ